MVEQNLAIITTVGQVVLEDVLAAESDVSPELLPTSQTNEQGSLESLVTRNPHSVNKTDIQRSVTTNLI